MVVGSLETTESVILPAAVDHGSTNAYNNYGCRCDACKLAWRAYQLPKVARRKGDGLPRGDKRHGSYNGYANYGCRCVLCVEANRQYALGYQVKTGQMSKEKAVKLGWKEKVDA